MGVKKVLDEQLVQYLFYGYSVHIGILSFQHENCKRMYPSGFQIITWQAVVLSLCLRGCWEDERGDAPAILLADNLSDRLHETGRGRKEMEDGAAEKHQEHVRNEKDDAHGPLPA